MKKEELLSVLSDININSETALEAVSLYIKYLYFEQFIQTAMGLLLLGAILWTVSILVKLLIKDL